VPVSLLGPKRKTVVILVRFLCISIPFSQTQNFFPRVGTATPLRVDYCRRSHSFLTNCTPSLPRGFDIIFKEKGRATSLPRSFEIERTQQKLFLQKKIQGHFVVQRVVHVWFLVCVTF
jgi:hypothetical protein